MLDTVEEIKKWLDKNDIKNYTISEDLFVKVNGDVWLTNVGLSGGLPVSFSEVSGNFHCGNNELTTLFGCPESVMGNFFCHYNKLINLEFCPKMVGGNFTCHYNELTSLVGCPEEVGDFRCDNNGLLDMDGCPKVVRGDFSYSNNENLDSIFKGMSFHQIRLYLDNKELNYSLSEGLLEVDVKKIIGRKI